MAWRGPIDGTFISDWEIFLDKNKMDPPLFAGVGPSKPIARKLAIPQWKSDARYVENFLRRSVRSYEIARLSFLLMP